MKEVDYDTQEAAQEKNPITERKLFPEPAALTPRF